MVGANAVAIAFTKTDQTKRTTAIVGALDVAAGPATAHE
jgi:hypothetical protein